MAEIKKEPAVINKMIKKIVKVVQFQEAKNGNMIILLSNGQIFSSGVNQIGWTEIRYKDELEYQLEDDETLGD